MKFYSEHQDESFELQLLEGDSIVGKLYVNDDGQVEFEGDATETARIFIDEVKRQWSNNE